MGEDWNELEQALSMFVSRMEVWVTSADCTCPANFRFSQNPSISFFWRFRRDYKIQEQPMRSSLLQGLYSQSWTRCQRSRLQSQSDGANSAIKGPYCFTENPAFIKGPNLQLCTAIHQQSYLIMYLNIQPHSTHFRLGSRAVELTSLFREMVIVVWIWKSFNEVEKPFK